MDRKSLEERLNNSRLSQAREQARSQQDERDKLLGPKQPGISFLIMYIPLANKRTLEDFEV